jgi:alpha-mannosidase
LWLLPFKEYFDITARNLLDLVEFVEAEPEYRFCLDQTVYIEKFMKKYPEVSQKLVNAVKAGLVEPNCSGYTQPDSNLPSGEFLVRNTVLYNSYIKKVFDIDVKCARYDDVYGQSAQLPQIFKEAGLSYFTFWRGCPVQGEKEPPTEFLWEGIDGTKILTHWMALSYGAGTSYQYEEDRNYHYHMSTTKDNDIIESLKNITNSIKEKSSTGNVFIPHGGDFLPPQRYLPHVVREWRKRDNSLDIRIDVASKFFASVEESLEKLPVVKGEFNPIFRGTYSARIKLKQANRRVENLYITAEKFAAFSSLFGEGYPEKDLEKTLKLILLNQFHDAINGEVIDEVYNDMMKDYYLVEEKCNEILEDSLEYIAGKIDTEGEGVPIIVFNQLSWSRTDVVKVRVGFGDAETKDIILKNHQGKTVPYQLSNAKKNPDATLNNIDLIFIAENVPALGYKVYFVKTTDTPTTQNITTGVKTTREKGAMPWAQSEIYKIENQHYAVTFDPVSKMISSVYDKKVGVEALDTEKYMGNVLFDEPEYGTVCHSNGDIDSHNTSIPIKDLPNPKTTINTMNYIPRGTVVESGPVRAVVRVLGRLQKSRFEQTVTLYDKVKRIECQTEIGFEGEHRKIRVAFPANVEDGKIWHEIPYGAIERKEGEYAAINWTDISNSDYGVTLINQGLPGNSIVDNVMLVTLLRSIDAMYLRSGHDRSGEAFLEQAGRVSIYTPLGVLALEKGFHTFNYALYPHEKGWKEAKSYKTALEFNNPLIAVKTTNHKGNLPKEESFVTVEPDNLVVTAVKKSKENLIVRLYEAEGKKTEGKLRFFKSFKSSWKTNLLETKTEQLEKTSKETTIKADKYKIKTILLETT